MEKTREVDSVHLDGLGAMPLHRLRRHAEQLATHLSAVATDLDRREAELAAERAQQEGMVRSARLWMNTRIERLSEVIAQLRQQVGQIQILSGQAVSEQRSSITEDQLTEALTLCTDQLETLEQQFLCYAPSVFKPYPEPGNAVNLTRRNAALDLREQSLKRDQIALAEAYQETMEIRDSAETLLQDTLRQKSATQRLENNSCDAKPLHAQTQALQEAEHRLRMLHNQMTAGQQKAPRLKKMEPPSWVQERQALVAEIDRLQAELEKNFPYSASRNAA